MWGDILLERYECEASMTNEELKELAEYLDYLVTNQTLCGKHKQALEYAELLERVRMEIK